MNEKCASIIADAIYELANAIRELAGAQYVDEQIEPQLDINQTMD